MKSLADYLGVLPEGQQASTEDAALDVKNTEALSLKDFCRAILNSAEYRASVLSRIMLGELPAQVEVMFYHYAGGKPTEHVEVKTVHNELEDLRVDQLEERALYLANLARQMRLSATKDSAEDDASSSIH